MILGFKQHFKKKILSKIKIHSMREDPHNRWKAGNLIHAYTGARTKEMKLIITTTCQSTQQVLMVLMGKNRKLFVTIDRRRLTDPKEIYTLAINDGFDSVQDMVDFFFPLNSKRTMLKRKLIHWTDFKY